jgi:hypothetical protein
MTKKNKKVVEPEPAPVNEAFENGLVNVMLTANELHQLVQFIWFCAETFSKLAVAAHKAADEAEVAINKRRTELCLGLHAKLKAGSLIGEPETKQIH